MEDDDDDHDHHNHRHMNAINAAFNGDATASTPLQPPQQRQSLPPQMQLRALQFNVWLDATQVEGGLSQIATAILDSQADVVSLNEVKNFWGVDFVTKLKEELLVKQEEEDEEKQTTEQEGLSSSSPSSSSKKQPHSQLQQQQQRQQQQRRPPKQWYGSFPGNPRRLSVDADTAIISRFPVVDQTVVYRTLENSIVRSLIRVPPLQLSPSSSSSSSSSSGRTSQLIAVYSVHLEYRTYSCYLPRGYNSHSRSFPGWNPLSSKQLERIAATTTTDQGRQQQTASTPAVSSMVSYVFWTIVSTIYGFFVKEEFQIDELHPVRDPHVIHVDNLSSGRPDAIMTIVQDVDSLVNRKDRQFFQDHTTVPILVMGDFNEPSALDWTLASKDTADHNGVTYEWETTRRFQVDAGFVDSYRQLYPNPVTHPGYTWPAAATAAADAAAARGNDKNPKPTTKTGWLRNADERDRIDFIFYKNQRVRVKDGEDGCWDEDETRTKGESRPVSSVSYVDDGSPTSLSSSSSFTIHPVDAWIVGTPVMVVGDALVDESSSCTTTTTHTTKLENGTTTKTIVPSFTHDKCSLKPDSAWPSDHRAVLTVFEFRARTR